MFARIKSMFKVPSAESLALQYYEDAKRSLLVAEMHKDDIDHTVAQMKERCERLSKQIKLNARQAGSNDN